MNQKINVFVSYSHHLDQACADDFAELYSDDIVIDKSVRDDLGDITAPTIKAKIRPLIAESSVTVVLIGKETGGRSWVDWEIYNSLRKNEGNERNGLLGLRLPNREHWTPDRLHKNAHMGMVADWPKTAEDLQEMLIFVRGQRDNEPDLSDPLRKRNSSRG